MSKKDKNDSFVQEIRENNSSVVCKGIKLSSKFAEKLRLLGEEVNKLLVKALDGKTYLRSDKTKESFDVSEYVLKIKKAKKSNIEISDETKKKLIDFVDFFEESLSDGIIEEIDNIVFNGNPNLSMFLAYMEIDSEENGEIYKQLKTILEEIEVS